MNADPKHYHVTLLSTDSQDIYFDIKHRAFTVELEQELVHGNNRWELGLCEFSCLVGKKPGKFDPSMILDETRGLIFCNLISPKFVGGERVCYLQTFTYAFAERQNVYNTMYYDPVMPLFKRVNT